MKRREFVEKAGLGAAALATLGTSGRAHASTAGSTQHAHSSSSGPLATATVSWCLVARQPVSKHGAAAGLPNNLHALVPNEVTIKAGGTVNFIVAGFHLIAVYGDGIRPSDIDTSITIAPTTQPVPPLINDTTNRVYLGPDPSVFPQLAGPPRDRLSQDCRIAWRSFTSRTRARTSSSARCCRISPTACSAM